MAKRAKSAAKSNQTTGREVLRRHLMSHSLHHAVVKVIDDRGNELLVVKEPGEVMR